MAYSDIKDPSAHFQTMLWTGNASSNEITFDGNSDLQADWIWHKEPNDSNGWHQTDTSIGIANYLASESTAAEYGVGSAYVSAIGSNSITYGSGDSSFNSNSVAQATWAWKANGSTTASNTSGSITSTVQANTDAGFSIVTYTGTGSTSTVGHGLGVKPDMMILKNRDSGSRNWIVYHKDTDASTNYFLRLNTTDAKSYSGGRFNGTQPTSSVFTVGTAVQTNENGDGIVAYCFNSVQGYSKFGKYVGNGSTDGAFVHTGFKPAFVMTKNTSATDSWVIMDKKRSPSNVANKYLLPNSSGAEGTNFDMFDFVSNGFKCRRATSQNASGNTFIYMAFAESPFVAGGVPTTAR